MLFSTWLSLVAVCLMGAMFPGASLAVVLRHTLNNSPLHGAVTGIAHATGIGIYALFAVLGLALLLHQSPILFKIISYAGAAYLFWLGYKGLTATASNFNTTDHAVAKPVSLQEAARDGFVISMLNPKVGLYFLALFSQFITPTMTLLDKTIFVATIAVIDGAWYVAVALILSQGPILKWLKQNQLWVERGLGVILIALALRILWL